MGVTTTENREGFKFTGSGRVNGQKFSYLICISVSRNQQKQDRKDNFFVWKKALSPCDHRQSF